MRTGPATATPSLVPREQGGGFPSPFETKLTPRRTPPTPRQEGPGGCAGTWQPPGWKQSPRGRVGSPVPAPAASSAPHLTPPEPLPPPQPKPPQPPRSGPFSTQPPQPLRRASADSAASQAQTSFPAGEAPPSALKLLKHWLVLTTYLSPRPGDRVSRTRAGHLSSLASEAPPTTERLYCSRALSWDSALSLSKPQLPDSWFSPQAARRLLCDWKTERNRQDIKSFTPTSVYLTEDQVLGVV
ncbi:leucine-rich repeat extensin-like protein 5 [Phacochoerus africanus]|uniref:leucine-rich repeat extensin-like protein 5 n=1 Tax=Phacochoerus africanus TaxID=41426 RepID=UPI001FDAB4E1|nr:leucine-rich repeat extensin-like protein 5 [Phacochoerus africanus]